MSIRHRDKLLANVATQAHGCHRGGSPFYGALFDRAGADIATGGLWWQLLEPFAGEDFETCRPLRIAGALHRLVLAGEAPALAAVWHAPIDSAWPVIEQTIQSNPIFFEEALARPVQTNEVGRSVALVGGFLTLAGELGLPVELREIGASGGLNLRPDRYWYEQAGAGWGDARSPVRFVDRYTGGAPPLRAPLRIAGRKGCDLYPIDIATAAGRAALFGFVWPGQHERMAALRAAVTAAAATRVRIERADAVDFVRRASGEAHEGRTLVFFHSIVWWYLPDGTRTDLVAALHECGAEATATAPVAWLRFEPAAERAMPVELRLTVWPGGTERLLAHGGFHRDLVEWLV